jgi:primosomal protein N' (replication factor Y)
LVELPRHSGLDQALHYASAQPVDLGSLVRVPLATRLMTGIVWACMAGAAGVAGALDPAHLPNGESPLTGNAAPLRDVLEVFAELPPLAPHWCELLSFAAGYYQRSLGELALAALPPELRGVDRTALLRRLKRLHKNLQHDLSAPLPGTAAPALPSLSDEQRQVLAALAAAPAGPHLLHGVTGSGKTEVYLREAQRALDAGRQALVLVPEINLTPQLEARFAERFPARRIVSLHSGLTPAQRLQHWLTAHLGHADLVLGTRMAVFASLPRLGLIVVDEEHDPSYKQQEGARYSARDLAVYRGRLEQVPVLLGSATPSLETWFNAQPQEVLAAPSLGRSFATAATPRAARYGLHSLTQRIGDGLLPAVRLLDLKRVTEVHGKQVLQHSAVAPSLLALLRERVALGEQSLVLLNRRGYAPVLHCTSCGWKSACAHCSAWRVFHKSDRTLRCHHCGLVDRVPRACPDCGDLDLQPIGRGTERVEEQLAAALPGARLARIDADTTRAKGSLEAQLASVHAGECDVLVGTQMVAKGHDFRRIGLVIVVNADAALFSADFRAAERLFALLMQAAGRAGRDAAQSARSEMWVQTWHPAHPLYAALAAHDFHAFARSQLAERQAAGLPPFSHLALLRAEARTQQAAQDFLAAAAEAAAALGDAAAGVLLYPAVPATVQRVANIERAQMLIESPQRLALQRFLSAWQPALHALGIRGPQRVQRWAIDVDPLSI